MSTGQTGHMTGQMGHVHGTDGTHTHTHQGVSRQNSLCLLAFSFPICSGDSTNKKGIASENPTRRNAAFALETACLALFVSFVLLFLF